MWQNYIVYLILTISFLWLARRVYIRIRHPESTHHCSDCTADCKLRGLIRPSKEQKNKECQKK